MEKALYITGLKDLSGVSKGEIKRIYFGPEFCQNLIPSIKYTDKIVKGCRGKGLGFTFVTPFVTEEGLKMLIDLFKHFIKVKISCEIVINDWGALDVLSDRFNGKFDLVLGRLLTRQHRDPNILKVIDKQSTTAVRNKEGKIAVFIHVPPGRKYQEGIRSSYVNSTIPQKFLSNKGIRRFELNNIAQGVNLRGIYLKKSLYTPFVNISTTRFCPMITDSQKQYRINVCKRECLKIYEQLSCSGIYKTIYKIGNTTFYKNPVVEKKAAKAGVDRIVYQKEYLNL